MNGDIQSQNELVALLAAVLKYVCSEDTGTSSSSTSPLTPVAEEKGDEEKGRKTESKPSWTQVHQSSNM